MGEILMKKFFSKDSFILSTFDSNQKRQSLVVSLVLILFFVFSAFTFFNALYAFADCIGSIVSGSMDAALRDATRSLPLFFSCFMSIWALLLCHGLFRNASDERRAKSLKKNAIALLAFAAANLVAIIVMLAIGKIHSLVEGSPSPWYPLDSILYSLIYVALGIFALIYPKKLQEKLPYTVPNRGPLVKKARGLYCTFMSFWMLIAIYSFAAFTIGLFIQDFANGYLFFSIALILVYFINCLFLVVWEFYYNELKEENKKAFLLPLAIVGLAVSVLVAILYFVGLGTNLDGPSNAGFGILPVAFAASVNIATLIVVFTPIIVSVVALIKGLLARKK
jgi:hypothetical protein